MAVGIYALGVFIVVVVMLSSYFLGARGKDRSRSLPYESGVKAFHALPSRFFIHYFLVAITFVIFDIESVFLYVWASAVQKIGWIGFFQVVFFVAMLLLALLYALHMGMFSFFASSSDAEEKHSP